MEIVTAALFMLPGNDTDILLMKCRHPALHDSFLHNTIGMNWIVKFVNPFFLFAVKEWTVGVGER